MSNRLGAFSNRPTGPQCPPSLQEQLKKYFTALTEILAFKIGCSTSMIAGMMASWLTFSSRRRGRSTLSVIVESDSRQWMLDGTIIGPVSDSTYYGIVLNTCLAKK